jgi:transketolase
MTRSMRQAFRDTAVRIGERDPRVVLVFGDVSVYLFKPFFERWPERFINAGICENTLISLGAGLSAQGFHPFVHTINPFLSERSYEQIKLDMCYNGFGGNLVSCGASFDYAWDGATHHSYSDPALLRLLPGAEVMQPGTPEELETLLESQYANGRLSYFRTSEDRHGERFDVRFGRGVLVRDQGADTTLVTAGPILGNVLEACRDLPVNLLYFHTLKPFDQELVQRFRHTRFLVVEDANGLHQALCEIPDLRVARHGLPDRFLTHYGTLGEIRGAVGLDPAGIRRAVQQRIAAT